MSSGSETRFNPTHAGSRRLAVGRQGGGQPLGAALALRCGVSRRRSPGPSPAGAPVGRGRRRQRRRRVPAPIRHRARLSVPEGDPGMDDAVCLHPRAGRPLDLAHRRRLHPAPTGPWPHRRSPTSLGAPTRPTPPHARAGPQGVSSTSLDDRHASQSTEIDRGGSGTTKGDHSAPSHPLSSGQEGGLSWFWGFNCKLRQPVARRRRSWQRRAGPATESLASAGGQDPTPLGAGTGTRGEPTRRLSRDSSVRQPSRVPPFVLASTIVRQVGRDAQYRRVTALGPWDRLCSSFDSSGDASQESWRKAVAARSKLVTRGVRSMRTMTTIVTILPP